MTGYAEKLRDPRWDTKRLQILERDSFACRQCGSSGLQLHVHHLRYRSGADPWDYPSEDLLTLCHRCHEKVSEDQQIEKLKKTNPELAVVRISMREMVQTLAERKALRPRRVPAPPKFDSPRAWALISALPSPGLHRPLMKFAHWLWNTGTHDMDLLMSLVEDRILRNPDKPYAYYAPDGPARSSKHDSKAIEQAEIDNDRLKREERAWLEKR